MNDIDYNDRFFVPVSNTGNGEADSSTVFHYRQRGDIVWATYKGGDISFGTLIATVGEAGRLEMSYSHVNRGGELMTGRCKSRPEVLPDGRLRLHESWQWTSGDFSQGESVVEEMRRDSTYRVDDEEGRGRVKGRPAGE
ncbi:MAG: n-acetylglutamate synthase [Acidobacteriota bacterium]|nr:n-acetylglutamate synthase [Acidobacteriota bacterium]